MKVIGPVNATFNRIKVWDFPGGPVVKNPPANVALFNAEGQGCVHYNLKAR